MKKTWTEKTAVFSLVLLLGIAGLTGCQTSGNYDDVATNSGYNVKHSASTDNPDAGPSELPETDGDSKAADTAGDNGTADTSGSSETADLTDNSTAAEAASDSAAADLTDNSAAADTSQTAANEKRTGTQLQKESLKIGILYTSDPNEGVRSAHVHDLGIQDMQANLGLSPDQIIKKTSIPDTDTPTAEAAIQECIDEGCGIIFTTSPGYAEAAAGMAENYPDIYFAQASGTMTDQKNSMNYFGSAYQARYLSGIAAGKKTRTNRIGYVAAKNLNNSEVTSGIDAFALGVYSVNPRASIYVKVTNRWSDAAREEQYARDLIHAGCDVLAQHCDSSLPQEVAAQNGVWGIAYNFDMGSQTPDTTLCSITLNWSAYYTQTVKSLLDGTWSGENYYGSMDDGFVDITGLSGTLNDAETISSIEDMRQQITDGRFHIFDGKITTNANETIDATSHTLDDKTINEDIHWYSKKVVILLNNGTVTNGIELLKKPENTETSN